MPNDFYDLFRNEGQEIDFDLYGDNCGDIEANLTIDPYGEHCRMVKPERVIEYIESLMAGDDEDWNNYRRLAPLLGLLKGFNPDQWESDREKFWIVHYGY